MLNNWKRVLKWMYILRNSKTLYIPSLVHFRNYHYLWKYCMKLVRKVAHDIVTVVYENQWNRIPQIDRKEVMDQRNTFHMSCISTCCYGIQLSKPYSMCTAVNVYEVPIVVGKSTRPRSGYNVHISTSSFSNVQQNKIKLFKFEKFVHSSVKHCQPLLSTLNFPISKFSRKENNNNKQKQFT